jgi:Zn-dependent protease
MLDQIVNYLIILLLSVPSVLVALTIHELSHGLVAYWMGDPTAKYMGRLTLNPLKHIDIIGALCMLFFRFGWAKPVPVNPNYFKKPRLGMALTALAGPVSNLLLGFIGAFFFVLSYKIMGDATVEGFWYHALDAWFTFNYYFVWLNISLALFNLIPIPPLDGSKVLLSFLPDSVSQWVYKYQHYISLGFFVLLFLNSRIFNGVLTGWLSQLVELIFEAFTTPFIYLFFS